MAKSTIITLRLSADVFGEVKRIASEQEIPAAYVLRRALRKGLGLSSLDIGAEVGDDTVSKEAIEGWE